MRIFKCDYCHQIFDSGNVFTITLEVEDFQEYREVVQDLLHISPVIKIDLCPVCIKNISLTELVNRLIKEQATLNANKPQLTPTAVPNILLKTSVENGITWKSNR